MTDNQRALMEGIIVSQQHEKDVVIIDVPANEKALESMLRSDHRRSIRVARRAGVQIERVDPTSDNLAVFHKIYDETMARKNAAERWRLPKDYFETTVRHLGPTRVSALFRIGWR